MSRNVDNVNKAMSAVNKRLVEKNNLKRQESRVTDRQALTKHWSGKMAKVVAKHSTEAGRNSGKLGDAKPSTAQLQQAHQAKPKVNVEQLMAKQQGAFLNKKAEAKDLLKVLDGKQNPKELLNKFKKIIVVNTKEQAPKADTPKVPIHNTTPKTAKKADPKQAPRTTKAKPKDAEREVVQKDQLAAAKDNTSKETPKVAVFVPAAKPVEIKQEKSVAKNKDKKTEKKLAKESSTIKGRALSKDLSQLCSGGGSTTSDSEGWFIEADSLELKEIPAGELSGVCQVYNQDNLAIPGQPKYVAYTRYFRTSVLKEQHTRNTIASVKDMKKQFETEFRATAYGKQVASGTVRGLYGGING